MIKSKEEIEQEIASIEFCMQQERDSIKNSKAKINTEERNVSDRKRSIIYYKNQLNSLQRILRKLLPPAPTQP